MTKRMLLIGVVLLLGGCDFSRLERLLKSPFPFIDVKSRTPIAVDAEVEKILNDWQKQRSGKKSVYATFKRTVNERAFKEVRVSEGSLRIRHFDRGRLDFKANASGKGRELFLWTKDHEAWQISADDRRATIYELDEAFLRAFTEALFFAWLVPTDKLTLQKHGRIQRVKTDGQDVVLRIDNDFDHAQEFLTMTIQLNKESLLPSKIYMKENADTDVTYEFTSIHENVEFEESDFVPPKIKKEEWRIARKRFRSEDQKKLQPTKPTDEGKPK